MDSLKILFAGESWFTYSVHQKGFDTFETAEYSEGAAAFLEMLSAHDHTVTYVPAHRVDPDFPSDLAALRQFDVTVLSDVGATPSCFRSAHSRVGGSGRTASRSSASTSRPGERC